MSLASIAEVIVPAIQEVTKDNAGDVLRSVKNLLDVREGRIGNPLDANITFRDLLDSGFAKENPGFTKFSPRSAGPIFPLTALSDGYDPTTDYTQPIQPAGLTVTSGFAAIYLSWTGAGYRNHAYTEIWRSTTNVLGNAILLGTTVSNVYADLITSTGTTYYYWIRFVSEANEYGPYNSATGSSGATGQISSSSIASLVADKITSGTLTAAISVNTGYIYGGVDPSKTPGASDYGTGYFLGLKSGSHQFYVGSPSKYVLWNGSNLSIKGTIYADAGAIGGATIDATGIQSNPYTSTFGWRLDNASGGAVFNNANVRGGIYGGDFVSGAWPYAYSGVSGFALDSSGLKLGDYWNGKYFQITQAGNVYAPNFQIVNGNATFSGNLSGAIVYAEHIVSSSATSFEQSNNTMADDTWVSFSFYMHHYGYVSVIGVAQWAYSGSSGSGTYAISITDDTATEPTYYTSGAVSWYSSAAPQVPTMMYSRYCSTGWNKAWLKIHNSLANASHYGQVAIFKSYR